MDKSIVNEMFEFKKRKELKSSSEFLVNSYIKECKEKFEGLSETDKQQVVKEFLKEQNKEIKRIKRYPESMLNEDYEILNKIHIHTSKNKISLNERKDLMKKINQVKSKMRYRREGRERNANDIVEDLIYIMVRLSINFSVLK